MNTSDFEQLGDPDRIPPLFPVEIIWIETVCYQELPVAISQRAAGERHVNTGERHDYIKYRILVKVLFGQGLDFWCNPRLFDSAALGDLIYRTVSIRPTW